MALIVVRYERFGFEFLRRGERWARFFWAQYAEQPIDSAVVLRTCVDAGACARAVDYCRHRPCRHSPGEGFARTQLHTPDHPVRRRTVAAIQPRAALFAVGR